MHACEVRPEQERCNFDHKLKRISNGGFMGHVCRWSQDEALSLAGNELSRATQKHGPMKGAHEGYAVILEELDELWAEVKKQKPDSEELRKEAIQVAAMALRFVTDVCK